MINIYDTHTMLAATELIKPKSTFLRDRYFPTSDMDIFESKKVMIDFKDEGGNKLAPVVLPHKGGIPVAREGYETEELEPPLVAPERTLTVDQLESRLPGEAVFSQVSPAQREANYLRQDMDELNAMIDAREEYMAAQTLLNNGYILKQYADRYGSSDYIEKEIKFYAGASNPATYTVSSYWSTASASIIGDIAAMANELLKRGLPASDLILGSDAADVMLSNSEIKSLLDNRRFVLANEVNPQEQADGSTLIAVLNVKGHLINTYAYTREYTDETTGQSTPFIPAKYAVVTAPGMGRTAYGAITQIETPGKNYVTYAAKRVPKITTDENGDTRTLKMRAKPLVMPKARNAAISAKVLD